MKSYISPKTYNEVYNVIMNQKEFKEKLPNDVLMHIRKNALRFKL